MEIRKINCMSDFDAILRLSDCRGNETGWPECDWRAEFFTASGVGIYRASCIGGECRNCFNDGGRIHVVFKDHRMGVGTLQCRLTLDLPDGIYPDGIRRDVSPAPLGVELVNGAGDCPTTAEIEMLLPFIKGDQGEKMTYADLTDEDKKDLISPLTAALEDYATTEDLDVAKRAVFIDQWNTACGIWGRYNEETGYFELNGLTDITYEEALIIFFRTISFSAQCSRRIYAVNDIRTNLPLQLNLEANGSSTNQSFLFFCSNNDNIEVLNFSTFSGSRISPDLKADAYQGNIHIVHNCPKLKKIVGSFSLYKATTNMWPFHALPNLEEVNISHLYTGTLHLHMLPKLNLNSFAYLVSHKYQKANTPVNVHPTVYAKFTGDTTNEEVAAMDPEELQKWMELVPLAAEKNITFVAQN